MIPSANVSTFRQLAHRARHEIARAGFVEMHTAAKKAIGLDSPEQQVRIGDGG